MIPLDPFNNDHEKEFIEPTSIAVVYQYKLEQLTALDQQDHEGNFFSEQDTSTSTLLQGERLCHYNTWFGIGLFMMAAVGFVFFYFQYHYNQINKWEFSTTFIYAWSLVRTIVSCFIFSKLMYAIQRKCEEIEMYVCYANDNINETNDKVKKYVKETFNYELKIAVTEMLKFAISTEDKKKMTQTLMNKEALPNEDDEVYKAIDHAIENESDDINIDAGDDEEKKVKRMLQSIKFNIKEKYNTHSDTEKEKRRKAHFDRYNDTIKKIIKERTKTDSDNGKKELALKYLKEHDKHFVNTAVATLSWLQLWFLLHWLLYIISTFMIFTVLIDAVALHVKDRVPHIEPGVGFHPVQILFLCLYSLVQCFVLVYPCLRAAGVTRTRQRVIKRISDEAYKFTNLNEINGGNVIPEFIESMKRRKFSFRLRILCASIPFNLNIAYLSIAFGFVGSVVALITTVTD